MPLHSRIAQSSSPTRCRMIYFRRLAERLLPVLPGAWEPLRLGAVPLLHRGSPVPLRRELPVLLVFLPELRPLPLLELLVWRLPDREC
ncbi:hypothetical protein JCM17042A_19050 [Ruminococcus champanellensis 18P13 = JCM 17042]